MRPRCWPDFEDTYVVTCYLLTEARGLNASSGPPS